MMIEQSIKVIMAVLSDTLSNFGFRKRGRYYFVNNKDDVMLLIELQKSRSSSDFTLVFTINLGVYSRTLAKALGSEMTKPETCDCHWTERLGFLLPGRDDKWWHVANIEEAEIIAKEICSWLVRAGLPTLSTVDSTGKLKDLWLRGKCPGLTDFQREEYLTALQMREKNQAQFE
jgi:hypothetical protein